MGRLVWLLMIVATSVAVTLHLLGYFWHRPPALVYYAILLINYAPKWIWLIPSTVILILSLRSSLMVRILGGLSFLLVLWMQDIQFKAWFFSPERAPSSLTILTMNTGGTAAEWVTELVKRHNPDIIMLQESVQKSIDNILDSTWHTHCTGHICMASRSPFDVVDTYSRAAFSDWGSFAATYDVQVAGQKIRVVNAHLETPRDAIGGTPVLGFSKQETETYAYEKDTELTILSALLDSDRPVLVGGDLNTVVMEAAYREHLGMFTNAVSDAASGINYTKYTRWHGVRIDHVITNNSVKIQDAQVLSDTGGDHRAVLVAVSVVQQ